MLTKSNYNGKARCILRGGTVSELKRTYTEEEKELLKKGMHKHPCLDCSDFCYCIRYSRTCEKEIAYNEIKKVYESHNISEEDRHIKIAKALLKDIEEKKKELDDIKKSIPDFITLE